MFIPASGDSEVKARRFECFSCRYAQMNMIRVPLESKPDEEPLPVPPYLKCVILDEWQSIIDDHNSRTIRENHIDNLACIHEIAGMTPEQAAERNETLKTQATELLARILEYGSAESAA